MAVEPQPTFIEQFVLGVENVANFLWGGSWNGDQILHPLASPLVVLLLGTGIYLMIGLKFMPLRSLGEAVMILFGKDKGRSKGEGEIKPYQALSTALSGQVGTGNLAGVATAIALGGPGAIFWMWITALLGMATAFGESSLAVRFRKKHENGHYYGGPMYSIIHGLGKKWMWLAVLFCLGTLFSALATGSTIQSNSITAATIEATDDVAGGLPCFMRTAEIGAFTVNGCDADEAAANGTPLTIETRDGEVVLDATDAQAHLASWVPGAILALLTFLVIIGGIKSIGKVAGFLVPIMAVAYIVIALITLILNWQFVPAAFGMIFQYAFNPAAAGGGFLGAAIAQAIRYGVARGLFSNEAGQGSAPIAHAAAQTNDPVRQGKLAMLGVFIDTMLICTMTALVILTVQGDFGVVNGQVVSAAWQSGLEASAITTAAYEQGIPFGNWFVAGALLVFAFTTIIGWSYYGERAITFLAGTWAIYPFRILWVVVVFVGATLDTSFVWRFGDIANAAMAAPNLLAILLLSGVVFAMNRESRLKAKALKAAVNTDAG